MTSAVKLWKVRYGWLDHEQEEPEPILFASQRAATAFTERARNSSEVAWVLDPYAVRPYKTWAEAWAAEGIAL